MCRNKPSILGAPYFEKTPYLGATTVRFWMGVAAFMDRKYVVRGLMGTHSGSSLIMVKLHCVSSGTSATTLPLLVKLLLSDGEYWLTMINHG